MSAVFRASQSAFRRRLVGIPRAAAITASSPLHETRRNNSTWAPPAYRRQRPPSSFRKRKSGQHGRSRQDDLWNHLQKFYAKDHQQEKRKRDLRTSFGRYDKLSKLENEATTLIGRYQQALFPDAEHKLAQKHDNVMVVLNNLQEQCHATDVEPPSWERILSTEEQFRNVGALVRQLIIEFARMHPKGESPQPLAEDLLRALIQLRADRSHLVRLAEKARLEQEKEEQNTFTGWFKQIFVMSPGEALDKTPDIMAHQDDKFGPLKRQYQEVIRSIHREAKEYEWEPEDYYVNPDETQVARDKLLKCADRMAALVDLLLQHGLAPTLSVTHPVMETYACIGSLESAIQAERIYFEICQQRVPQDTFHVILRGYRLAALMEQDTSARADAAMRAQAILLERLGANAEAYSLVLETFRNAGKKALPDMIGRSEHLLKQFCGKDLFYKVVDRNGVPQSNQDLSVFESLACMYAEAGGTDKGKSLQRAKNILECAEDRRKVEQGSSTNNDKALTSTMFPSVDVYNVILSGIMKEMKCLKAESRKAADVRFVQQMMRDEAMYATSFLDRMVVDRASLPNQVTFARITKIWAFSKLPESGERADEILSRWNIRRACTGPPVENNESIGYQALRCWATSANASIPGALERALRILRKEEASTGANKTPFNSANAYSDAEKKIIDHVYENRGTALRNQYNAAILVCSLCRHEPEAALEAAFDIYNRMIAGGMTPIEETFILLISCCSNLLPKESKRRSELAETVVAFARDSGVSTEGIILKMHKEKLRRGSK